MGFEHLNCHCQCISINLNTYQKDKMWINIIADARFLPLKDNSINYVISNSVIEHIENGALIFSKEVKRVSKNGYFISCPYYYILIEPHYFVPLFQFIPEKVKKFLIFRMGLSIGHISRKNYEVIQIPTTNYLKSIFPNTTLKIVKLYGLPWNTVILY